MLILIITYILNVIDYLETLYLIQQYGIAVEGNPIMRFFFENQYGWVAKLIVPAVLLIGYGIIAYKDRRLLRPIYAATSVYVFLVIHNLSLVMQVGVR
jgi:hypothetical protein